jgi:hypothetical protein
MTSQAPKSPQNGGTGSKPTAAPRQQSWHQKSWLGWVAVLLLGLILIAAVWLGLQQLNNGPEEIGAEVQMTPIVGGMAVPTATPGLANGEPEVTVTSGSVDAHLGPATSATTATAAATSTGSVTLASTLSGAEESGVTAGGLETISATVVMTAGTGVGEAGTTSPSVEAAAQPAATAVSSEPQVEVIRTPQPVFAPGATVGVATGRITLHAEPSESAPVLDSLGDGATVIVLEPGGDFTAYPVEADGHGWARVRAADGLVGWTPTDGLILVE